MSEDSLWAESTQDIQYTGKHSCKCRWAGWEVAFIGVFDTPGGFA